MLPKILTTKEVIDEIKVSPRTLDRWLAASEFPAPFRIGRARRWFADDVHAYLKARKSEPATFTGHDRGRPPYEVNEG